MYVNSNLAMQRRRRIEAPTCAVRVMQQPDLGALGRLIGPSSVTLGDVVNVGGLPVQTSANPSGSGFSFSPYLIGAVLLLGGLLWYRSRLSAGSGLAPARPRRRRTKRIPAWTAALYAAGAGAGGYLVGKYVA